MHLTLDLAAAISQSLEQSGNGLSEYCFTNLYLYRHVHEYRYLPGEYGFVAGTTYDGERHLLPLFDITKVPRELLEELITDYDCFYPIQEITLSGLDPERFTWSFNRDDSDYFYIAENFINYSGNRLRKKKNLMHHYQRDGSMEIFPLDSHRAGDAMGILDAWQSEKNKPEQETDYAVCREALQNIDVLPLQGFIHYKDGHPAGFLAGTDLGGGICAIRFAKGLKTHKGIYPFMFHDYAVRCKDDYQYYNFEQDLGLENFRKTKKSYRPEKLLHKYRVRMC